MSQVTGFSPYYFMYGRTPKIPIDVEFGVTFLEMSENSHQNYADKLKARLKWAYKVAHDINEKESARHKKYYDKKYKCMKILPGDLVLMRVKAFGDDHKIADQWEQIPYEVLEQTDKGPMYKVRMIQGPDSTKVRTLHRNMLFPLQSKREDICTAASEQRPAVVRANAVMDAYLS